MKIPQVLRTIFILAFAVCMAAGLALTPGQTAFAQGLADVYVDDGYCDVCANDGHTWGVDAFATIQAGIDAAAAGGTVHVGPGSYNQALILDQWVVIEGAGDGTDPLADTIITSPTSPVFLLQAGGTSAANRTVLSGFRVGPITGSAFYTDVTLGYITLQGLTITGATNYGIEIHNNARATDLVLDDVTLMNNVTAFRVRGQLDGLQITDSLFEANTNGLYSVAATADSNYLRNVTVTGTEFTGNTLKGMYLEKLSNALFDHLVLTGNGATGLWAAGIDINLKYEAYTNITIQNSVFEDNGTGDAVNGTALAIKARDDSPSYNTNPASLSGVIVRNNSFSGSPQALRFGEPAQNNAGPTGVSVLNNAFSGNTTSLINTTQADIASTCNSWDEISGPDYLVNPGGLGEVITHTSAGEISFAPWLIDTTDGAPGETGFQLPVTVPVAAGTDDSLADNGFRRIQNAVGCAVDGQTIELAGTFYWNYTEALAAYDDSVATSATADIRGAEIPSGVDNLTITSPLGDALIVGSGDYADLVYDAFLFTDDGPAVAGNTNLTISRLNATDFESMVVMGWNSTGRFDGTQVMNNFFTLAGDDYDVQNIAVYFSHGTGQSFIINRVSFQADGTRSVGSGARSFGFQNSTTGGTGYDELEIGANVFELLPSSTGTEIVYGVWENGHNDDNAADIRILNNTFRGRAGDLFDRALLLSSQTDGLEIRGNNFEYVDNVFFASANQGHSLGDHFTFEENTLQNVGGADGIFLQNVTNDATPVHIGVTWDVASTVDGETGILGLNELSVSAVHAARPASAATDILVVDVTPPYTGPVFVDDDFAGAGRFSDPDGVGVGYGPLAVAYNAFATIQEGVDAADVGGLVTVLPGTYIENVIVDKPVEIAGAGQDDVIVYPSFSNPDCRFGGSGSICGGGGVSSNVFLIQANDITIHDLTVDGDNPALTSGVVRGGADLDARNGIIHNHAVGSFDNMVIYNTTVRNIYLRGVYNSSSLSTGFYIHDNTLYNIQGENQSIAIMNWASSGVIANNVIYDANDGIAANHSTGSTYADNEVYNSGSGVHSDNNGSSGGVADVLDGNYVHDCAVNGYGVWVFAPYLDVQVTSNRVENCAVGLTISGNFGGQTTFSENIVDGEGLAGSTGVYQTTSLFGWGSDASDAIFTRNIIINNEWSFYFESEAGYTLTNESHFNVVVDNPAGADAVGTGVYAIDAENNWWGCNAGPGGAGCDPTIPALDGDPWLVLGLAADPTAISVGETSDLTADLIWNSDGVDTSTLGYLPDGLDVGFGSDVLGTVAPVSASTILSEANSVFTAGGLPGVAVVDATVHNQTVTATITIDQPLVSLTSAAYTAGEADGTVTITATLSYAPGYTTTVDFAATPGTADAADFTPTSGTLTFQPGDTQETFTITILDDSVDEPAETVNIALSNPTYAGLGDPAAAVLTITDDEAVPTISLNAVAYTAAESAGTANITAVLSGPASYPITVDYAASDGTAIAGADYTAASGTLTFAPLDTSESFTVGITEDTLDELDETVHLALSNPSTSLGTPAAADLTITDNDEPPVVEFSTLTYSVNEDGTTALITVNLSAASGLEVSVDYATADGTATAGQDYTAASGTLTFIPGDITETFSVSITDDTLDENDETVLLSLTGAVNASAGPGATLTIVDNEGLPTAAFSATSYSVDEDGGTLNVTVNLSFPSAFEVTVDYATVAGSAGTADFTPATGTLTFIPGDTQESFNVTILDDVIDEPDEAFDLHLSNPVNANAGPDAAVTILDDEATPAVSFSLTNFTADEDDLSATITVNLSGESAYTVSVDYNTADGTAAAGEDYTAATGTLTFVPGDTSETFTVTLLDDVVDEPNETVVLHLSDPVNAVAGPDATLTLVDNELTPTASHTPGTYTVNEDGISQVIAVNLSGESAYTVSVDYDTQGGTATPGADYTPASGTLTFVPGDTTETFTVTILDDVVDEPDETVNLVLSNGQNCLPGPDALLTIIDDESAPTADFSAASYSVDEDGGAATITVNLSGPSAFEVTVDYEAAPGTAGTDDFVPATGTLTFAPGDTSETFAVTILDDLLDETDETAILSLSSGSNATLTILDDDDLPTVQLEDTDFSVVEDAGPAVITVTLSTPSALEVSVDYTASDGTAGSDDYTPISGTLTFAPGETEAAFEIDITADQAVEADETVLIDLSAPVNAVAGEPFTGTLTILNDDSLPEVTFSSPDYTVSESGVTAVITVELSSASAYTITVEFEALPGTAGSSDFTPVAGMLTFAPGETTATFEVSITNDSLAEDDETVILHLSDPVNATAGPDATLTIVDDDEFVVNFRLFMPIVNKELPTP